ncbi:MAG: hypothetical protein CMI90_01660 [Pelagibacteraceae bacterium]|nr:hypothetical protein [Pelagibacteraceae bacterium]|tara:strand:- start:1502 stop:2020 length:519 start_codon:yes stop_codon:yes gene_type:complete
MKELISSNSVDVKSLNLIQIILRSKFSDNINQEINSIFKIDLPKENLKINIRENIICSKSSFDQWNIIDLLGMSKNIDTNIDKLNRNKEVLVTNFSEGQSYFEISGENKVKILNKITHFDFRKKMFPNFTSAQTLIARVDCSIYNLENKFLITCNRSFGNYIEERLIDAVKY